MKSILRRKIFSVEHCVKVIGKLEGQLSRRREGGQDEATNRLWGNCGLSIMRKFNIHDAEF
jgi:hypothetical protein